MRTLMRVVVGVALCLLPLVGLSESHAQVGNQACTFQTASSTTGNGTACPVGGYNTLTFQVSATAMGTGTVAFEGTVDGTHYVLLLCMDTPGLIYVNNTSAQGVYHCSVKNFAFARARIVTAGTAISVSGYANTLTWGTGAF